MTFMPDLGRWMEEDPIGFAADDPNLYRYEGNNPTNFLDPSGLSRIERQRLPDGRYALYYIGTQFAFYDTAPVFVGIEDPLTEMVERNGRFVPSSTVISSGNAWGFGMPNWNEMFRDRGRTREQLNAPTYANLNMLLGLYERNFHNQAAAAQGQIRILTEGAIWQTALPVGFTIRIAGTRGLAHSFNSHAANWFGRSVTGADRAVWQQLVERVGRSRTWFESYSGVTRTYATLARIEGRWFVVHVYRAGERAGQVVTAYVPNQEHLRAFLRLMRAAQ